MMTFCGTLQMPRKKDVNAECIKITFSIRIWPKVQEWLLV